MDSNIKNSWLLATFSVLFLWGINNVMLGVGSKVFAGNAIIYSCTAFATGALSLLLYAGPGALAKERKTRTPPASGCSGKGQRGADHVQRAVGKIDHPQHSENKRKTGSNNEQNHSLAQAVNEDK